MITTWLPMTQSCATWLEAMTRQWSPIRVSSPSCVARWIVAYSRTAVSSPIRTPTGVPSRNLKSCGRPPMTAPWPIRQRAPTSVPSPRRTSGPMTEYGPTRTPAASSALGSITAEEWIMSGPPLLLQLPHPFLQGADLPDQIRQHALGRPDPPRLHRGPGRRPAPPLPGRDIAGPPRLRRHNGAPPHRHVVNDADLSRQHGAAPDAARPRDPYLGHEDHVLAQLTVVPDLHQIVDLAPPADHRVAQGPAIDGRVGPDFHVIADAQPAHLGDLAVDRAVERVAEAVSPEHRPGMDDYPVADPDAVSDDDTRVQHYVLADHHAGPDEAQRPDAAPGPDDGPGLDHGMGAHGGRGVHAGAFPHSRRGVDAWRLRGLRMKQA